MIVGDPARVKEQLEGLIQDFKADEVLLIPLMPGIEVRRRAIGLLAELF